MASPPKDSAGGRRKVLEGVFGINKPQWASSAGVLRDLQAEFAKSDVFQPWLESQRRQMLVSGSKQKHIAQLKVKLGHGGTLDPMATGVLIVGMGRGTKELGKFLECTKSYECVVLFGAATDSYDAVGKVVSTADYAHVTRALVEEKLNDFRGDMMQKPSVFSALKVDGKKMYEYAREGKDIPVLAARPVTVQELELVDWLEPGTHHFAWPKHEVDAEAKAGAEKLLGIRESDAAQHLRNAKRARSPSTKPHADAAQHLRNAKRARSPSTKPHADPSPSSTPTPTPTPTSDAGPQPKKPRTDNEPAMSGALPTAHQIAEPESQRRTNEEAQVEGSQNPAVPIQRPLDTDIPEPPIPSEKQPADSIEQAEVVDQACTSAGDAIPPPAPIDRPHQPPAARLRMTVTSGFYVRSLCHDLGLACGSLGLMSSLVRTRQGDYQLHGANVLEYADLEKGPAVWEPQVESFLTNFMEREGWAQEELEDEETWQVKKKELIANRKDDDRSRSYRGGGGGGRGKYRGGGGGGRYSKKMDGGRNE